MIPVTKPFQPPIEEYQDLLKEIWTRNWFTNNGPLVNHLESQLQSYLEQKHVMYVSNGTIALQIALKALNITKKVITTPFSYIATTSSLVWEGCTPVFVDIDIDSFNIDPKKIEKSVDPDTEAILATHCFGNPCDIKEIEKIAKKYGLKVIYDAAHGFGTTFDGKSIFSYGDISITSFHATKLFHTVEGGALFTQNSELAQRIAYMRNFGHDGPERFSGIGINGKNSEFHAAMGLVNLKYIKAILAKRKEQSKIYDDYLKGMRIKKQMIIYNSKFNFAYHPIIFENEEKLLATKTALEKYEIFTRRYFYPSLSSLPYVQGDKTPVSDYIAARILCLPLYHELSKVEQQLISKIIIRTLK